MDVSTGKLSPVVQTMVQYLAALFAGWMIRHGYIGADDSQLILGAMLALVAAGLGVYKTIKHKNQLVEAATTPPSQINLK